MRNFTEMGYETITVIRSQYPPELGKCLGMSPVLWIQTIENANNARKDEKRFFVFSRNNCIKEIYEISQAISDFVDGIITPCGTILPIDKKLEFLDSEGIGLECVEGKLKFVIKVPLDTSLGGTSQTIYREGDLLVGNKDGKLSILIKGEIGQLIGVKEDGSLGFITNNNGINTIVTPCGEITPIDGVVKITTGQGLESSCQGNEVINKLKSPVATNLGGTGIQQYNQGDVLIGKEDGTLEKLSKGTSGQVLGIKNDGNLGYINPSSTSNFQKCTAYLQSNTADVTGDQNIYFLGSTDSAFAISSQIGDGFYGGNANGNPASFTCREKGDYLFILNIGYAPRSIQGTATAGFFRVILNHYNSANNIIAQYESITRVIGQEFLKHLNENLSKSIIMDINENVKFSVQSYLIGTTRRVSILGRENSLFRTYIDIYKIR